MQLAKYLYYGVHMVSIASFYLPLGKIKTVLGRMANTISVAGVTWLRIRFRFQIRGRKRYIITVLLSRKKWEVAVKKGRLLDEVREILRIKNYSIAMAKKGMVKDRERQYRYLTELRTFGGHLGDPLGSAR